MLLTLWWEHYFHIMKRETHPPQKKNKNKKNTKNNNNNTTNTTKQEQQKRTKTNKKQQTNNNKTYSLVVIGTLTSTTTTRNMYFFLSIPTYFNVSFQIKNIHGTRIRALYINALFGNTIFKMSYTTFLWLTMEALRNIKMPHHQYRDSHYKYKIVTIYIMGILYHERRSLYWDGALVKTWVRYR